MVFIALGSYIFLGAFVTAWFKARRGLEPWDLVLNERGPPVIICAVGWFIVIPTYLVIAIYFGLVKILTPKNKSNLPRATATYKNE